MKHVLMHASLHSRKALRGLKKDFQDPSKCGSKEIKEKKASKVSPNLALSSQDLTRGKPNLSCDLLLEQSGSKLLGEAPEGRKIPPRRHCHSVIQHTASPVTFLIKTNKKISFVGLQLDM